MYMYLTASVNSDFGQVLGKLLVLAVPDILRNDEWDRYKAHNYPVSAVVYS